MSITVKCLTEAEKDGVITYYTSDYLIKDIADIYQVSPRTINRVIIERGYYTPVAKLQEEASMVMKLLKQYGVRPEELEHVLQQRSMYRLVLNSPGRRGSRMIPALLLKPAANASPYYPTTA